jgi:hypothetical protein
LTERNEATIRDGDADLANGVKTGAVGFLPPYDEAKAAVTFEHLGNGLTTDCGLDNSAYIADVKFSRLGWPSERYTARSTTPRTPLIACST